MKSRRTKATDISQEVKQRVFDRDGGLCIVCHVPGMPNAHYIRRASGGLGIEQNIVTLCSRCHDSYDNGFHREEIGKVIREYLKAKYPNWREEDLIYNKWKAFKIR